MGRFFITDSQSAFDTARKINEKAGLEENGIISGEGFQGVIYDKRAISVENIFSSDNEAQLASVGTALYHESLGAKSFR